MRCAEFLESTFDDPSTALKDYFSCESVAGWETMMAVLL